MKHMNNFYTENLIVGSCTSVLGSSSAPLWGAYHYFPKPKRFPSMCTYNLCKSFLNFKIYTERQEGKRLWHVDAEFLSSVALPHGPQWLWSGQSEFNPGLSRGWQVVSPEPSAVLSSLHQSGVGVGSQSWVSIPGPLIWDIDIFPRVLTSRLIACPSVTSFNKVSPMASNSNSEILSQKHRKKQKHISRLN